MSHTHIRIRSSINGFRRAGITHSADATVYPIDAFSASQLKQLEAEPRLSVEFITENTQADSSADTSRSLDDDGVETDLNSLTVEQLRDIAAAGEIDGYKTLKKAQLIEAIEAAREANPEA
jgi:hypothetical protein